MPCNPKLIKGLNIDFVLKSYFKLKPRVLNSDLNSLTKEPSMALNSFS